MLDRPVSLRSEILASDLRPRYLPHLAVIGDDDHDPDEAVEAPVPAGLKKPTDAQYVLAEFVGVSETMIAAAAERSGPLPEVVEDGQSDSPPPDRRAAPPRLREEVTPAKAAGIASGIAASASAAKVGRSVAHGSQSRARF